MKAEENKKALADAEYFITCEDQYADIIIDGKIKQGAKLLVSFAEEYCEEKTCEWKYDEEFCFYDTECDEAYQLEVGDLDENKHNYCPFCGGKIVLNKPINNNIMKTDLENAINVLTDSLAEDSDYYQGWLANIAMAMYDEFKEAGISHPQLHELCNKGAKRFLDYLINL